jgi:hypothetical protein
MNDLSPHAQAALAFVEAGGAIPKGKDWDKLYKLLPLAPDGNGPPAPLILAAEHMTNTQEKQDRMVEHILWAEQHGAIEQFVCQLLNLSIISQI